MAHFRLEFQLISLIYIYSNPFDINMLLIYSIQVTWDVPSYIWELYLCMVVSMTIGCRHSHLNHKHEAFSI